MKTKNIIPLSDNMIIINNVDGFAEELSKKIIAYLNIEKKRLLITTLKLLIKEELIPNKKG